METSSFLQISLQTERQRSNFESISSFLMVYVFQVNFGLCEAALFTILWACVQAQKQEMVLNLEEHKKEASAVMASTNEALTVHKIETVKSLETWKNGFWNNRNGNTARKTSEKTCGDITSGSSIKFYESCMTVKNPTLPYLEQIGFFPQISPQHRFLQISFCTIFKIFQLEVFQLFQELQLSIVSSFPQL